jgi:surface protein
MEVPSGVWVNGVMYFDQSSSFQFLFLRIDCECNRPSFLAPVFHTTSVFNGDLSLWNVEKVTNMQESKSVRIVNNDLTRRELMLLCDCSVPSGAGRFAWGFGLVA